MGEAGRGGRGKRLVEWQVEREAGEGEWQRDQQGRALPCKKGSEVAEGTGPGREIVGEIHLEIKEEMSEEIVRYVLG